MVTRKRLLKVIALLKQSQDTFNEIVFSEFFCIFQVLAQFFFIKIIH